MPEFLFLMIFNVIFYTLVAYTLFSPNKNDQYFSSLFESFISIFVLQTTANYPDVTVPSVTNHPAASLFFISFLLIQLYFVFNLNIATVFNIYKGELEERVIASYIRKRVAILAAFKMLDTESKGYITMDTWKSLFKTIRPWSDEQKAIAKFEKENVEDTGRISLVQFFHLCDDIMKGIERPRRVRKAANFIHFPLLLKIVNHKLFKLGIIVLTGLNCVFVVLQLIFEDYGHPSIWSKILEPTFIVLFTLELLLKLGGQGPKGFIRRKWNL
jgi:two pore calcium channel protein 1